MTSTISFGIAIPQVANGGRFDTAAARELLQRAEELGFDSAWAQEQVLGAFPDLGPMETMAWAAAVTTRLRLGCAVIVSTLHSPVHLAASIATVDQLSGGRLEVGFGTGGGARPFAAFGVDPATYVARFTEGIALMRRLWTDEQVDFDGRFWQLSGVAMEPKPIQQPAPPVWIGGAHPNAVRRVVALADGFFGAGSQTTAAFAKQVATLRAALADAGRDPATCRVAKRVYVAVDDDADRARRRAGEELHRIYRSFASRDLTPVAVAGPVDAVIAGLREVVAAGAELVMLNPLFDDMAQMEWLAADVIPHVR